VSIFSKIQSPKAQNGKINLYRFKNNSKDFIRDLSSANICFLRTGEYLCFHSLGSDLPNGAANYFGAINCPAQCPFQGRTVTMVELTLAGVYPINNWFFAHFCGLNSSATLPTFSLSSDNIP